MFSGDSVDIMFYEIIGVDEEMFCFGLEIGV